MNIKIYCAQADILIKEESLTALLEYIPGSLRSRAHRYKSDSSAYNYVLGRLMLMRGLEDFGLDADLEKIVIQKNGKPTLTGIHFNISHSGDQVGCAFSKDGKLGFDLEKVEPIQFEDFTAMFSNKEWNAIMSTKDPLQTFYWFWTRKESIIKADGLSLSDMHEIELDVSNDHVVFHGKSWYLRELNLGHGFKASICTEKVIGDLTVEWVELNI